MDMGDSVMADDNSLLERVLMLTSQKAHTLESLSSEVGISEEDLSIYWFAANTLRRSQGHRFPVPDDIALSGGEGSPSRPSSCWHSVTWRLGRLLEEFQINEGLAVHYGDILFEPEGGHYQLNLAASEVVLAMQMEKPSIDADQMKRICVQACEPTNGIELLACNAGKILLSIEQYREEPITASFITHLYGRLTEGISVKEVHEAEERGANAGESYRDRALDSFCATLWPNEGEAADRQIDRAVGGRQVDCGNHTLVNALIAFHFFKTFRLFLAGNSVLAYLMYVIILHRSGYHFSAHVPVVKLYQPEEQGGGSPSLPCDPEGLAVECDGYYDWTRFLECATDCIIGEQRWMMTRLDGMSRRRERFRTIIDADESMNFRQKEVLLEAALHSNAEFTYGIHEQRYDVSYPCARSDFARLLDRGFLRQHDDGTRHFFVASDSFNQAFLEYLKTQCPEAYYRYYGADGLLLDEHKSADEAAIEYNRGIGFYEKLLLDKTYIEHYDFRRTPIADNDGPHRRSRSKDRSGG